MTLIRNFIIAVGIMGASLSAPAVAYASATETSMVADAASMRVAGGRLELTVAGDHKVKFEVYSITGQLVKQVVVADGTASVDLPKGVYIVKTDRWARQIVVR